MNEAYRRNLSAEGSQYGQQSNYPGVSIYGADPNWASRNESPMYINEQGSLYNPLHKGKGPKGYRRSDERIKEDISDRMMDDSLLDASDIELEVDNNEVVLTGTVDNREAKRRAEYLAECIPGVGNVENRLRIKERSTERRPYSSSSTTTESKSRRGSFANVAD